MLDHLITASYRQKNAIFKDQHYRKCIGREWFLPMENDQFDEDSLEFLELVSRYGRESAFAILRMLEEFEGVLEARVANLSFEERLQNVFRLMKENPATRNATPDKSSRPGEALAETGMRFQTRH